MRELTVRIKFTKACLGNVKKELLDNAGRKWPCFFMPRTPDGNVRFEANWWKASLRFASDVLCRHQKDVSKVHFDVSVDGRTDSDTDYFYKRYFSARRFVKHEAFREGEIVGINCLVPDAISDDDFWKLMDLVGRFKGISPYGPREYGFFVVEGLIRRNHFAPVDRTRDITRSSPADDDESVDDLSGRERDTDNPARSADPAGTDGGVEVHPS